MKRYTIPGFYIEEIKFPLPSVVQVSSAIPAFIGYTAKGPNVPTRIRSMADYIQTFGGPNNQLGIFEVGNNGEVVLPPIKQTPDYRLFYMLEMFFANGGRDCFIVRAGSYDSSISNAQMKAGLALLEKEDDPTLILFPDAISPLNMDTPYDLYNSALEQCTSGNNRFLICDVKESSPSADPVAQAAADFRNGIGTKNLMFGAAYFPGLITTLSYRYSESEIRVVFDGDNSWVLRDDKNTSKSLFHAQDGKYRDSCVQIKNALESVCLILPSSAAIAGVYTSVDSTRGVWKAPANVALNAVTSPTVKIDDRAQDSLNVTHSGKSINAIRDFPGRGVMVWGARTLAGNDNEWRYIPVRRFFSMVEESVRKSSAQFVFEPNDANTWVSIKTMIENYLMTLWRAGALMGSKPEEAFFVQVGLGRTMTQKDVLNRKLIVEIGMAAIRPAAFTILRISLTMAQP
jgi:uncharacterized protein